MFYTLIFPYICVAFVVALSFYLDLFFFSFPNELVGFAFSGFDFSLLGCDVVSVLFLWLVY